MTLRLASLCTGYGGLEMGLALAGLPFDLVAVADNGAAASTVLARRHPDVPNLGDLRTIDWARLEAEVVTAGFPCQPVSNAGHGLGTDDERWLFDAIAEGIGGMGARPRLLVFENVLGLLTANRGHAMGRVLRGLAALGYVGRYRVLRASDVGAAHQRARVFIVAWQAGEDPADLFGASIIDATGNAVLTSGPLPPTPRTTDGTGPGKHGAGGLDLSTAVATMLPTPNATHGRKQSRTGPLLPRVVDLLPTPQSSVAAYAGDGYGPTLAQTVTLLPTPAAARSGRQRSASPGAAVRPSLDMIRMLLPTPRASDGAHGGPNQRGSAGDLMLTSAVLSARWGDYAPAVHRWEKVFGRPAPDPIDPRLSRNGNKRISPRFVEWLMGLPDRYVTGLVRHNAALALLGNGVMPMQAAVAVRELVNS